MMDTRANDRMYNCLPMYHGTGGVVATGAMLINGGSVLIRQRFSASQFWDDVAESNCTLFQYIGELCRYLLNAPPHPRETGHRLRLCCGNGLGADIWEKFQARFGIPRILEFYAATEGTFSLYNCEGKPGAIGRIPPFLAHRSHVAIVRFDAGTGKPIRDSDGHCIRCAANEAGEAIGRLAAGDPLSAGRFEGYTDRAATNEKLLQNVFANGDAWFRTGDLMRKDEHGYFYFVDRIGDTFRWKGENVSTTEVAAVILAFPSVSDAAVYGVTVPGAEGRAGMAAITITPDFDLAAFRLHLIAHLPEYAHPLFLRVCDRIEQTGTFRLKKHDLALEGYDPGTAGDAVYFNERERQAFVPFDPALRDRIVKAHSG
jgi:fatty-acyl-CoA synthase